MQEAGKGVEVEAGDGLTFSFGQTNEHAMTKRHEILAYSSLPLATPLLSTPLPYFRLPPLCMTLLLTCADIFTSP